MNVIERCIESVYRRVREQGGPVSDADQLALGTAFLVMRSGRAPTAVLIDEMNAWAAVHGPPTREKLDRWAAGLGVEAGIAQAGLRAHAERQRNERRS